MSNPKTPQEGASRRADADKPVWKPIHERIDDGGAGEEVEAEASPEERLAGDRVEGMERSTAQGDRDARPGERRDDRGDEDAQADSDETWLSSAQRPPSDS